MTATAESPARTGLEVFDTGSELHEPDLYRCTRVATPLYSPAAIDAEQIRLFHERGYLAIEGFLTPAEADACSRAMQDLIFWRARHTNYHLMFEAAVKGHVDSLSAFDREAAVRKVFNFDGADERIDNVMLGSKLLGTLEKLGCLDPQLFQVMALLKGPNGREKPWHQDHAYFAVPLQHRIIGCWIALDDATIDNGCMCVIEGHHKKPLVHWQKRDWQICDTESRKILEHAVAVPLRPGGILFFDSLLPHGTPYNSSSDRRRALQFHYAPGAFTRYSRDEHMAHFGNAGKEVTC